MLAPVDRVEVTIVIDNFVDVLLAGEEGVARYQARDLGAPEQLVAEFDDCSHICDCRSQLVDWA